MKALFTLLFASCSLVASAQTAATGYGALPKDSTTHEVAYVGVVQVPGVSQAELFGRAGEWLARVGASDVAADAATGRQIAHLSFKQPPLSFTDTHSNLYTFAVAVYTKEGKYMYRVDDFSYQNINPALATKDAQKPVALSYYATVKENKRVLATLNDFNQRVTALIDGLNSAMAGKKTAPKGW